MNKPGPFVPQGSLVEQQRNQARTRVRNAVVAVLAIHGIGLLFLLMQGCNQEPGTTTSVGEEDTKAAAAQVVMDHCNAPPQCSNRVGATRQTITNVEPTLPPASELTVTVTEYKVFKGDTYTRIARKFHTTPQGLIEANPQVDPARLQIGQTLRIPGTAIAHSKPVWRNPSP